MDAAIGDDLTVGIEALERADWKVARSALERVLKTSDVPDAYEGLGLALWFLGDVAAGIAERERAFEGYVRAGRCDDAARIGVWVSHQHSVGGRASAARGWLARAERALETPERAPDMAGWRSNAPVTRGTLTSRSCTRGARWRSRAHAARMISRCSR
jgi:hypothetical protein